MNQTNSAESQQSAQMKATLKTNMKAVVLLTQDLINNLLDLLELDSNERTKCACMEESCDIVLKPCGHVLSKMHAKRIGGKVHICRTGVRNKVSFVRINMHLTAIDEQACDSVGYSCCRLCSNISYFLPSTKYAAKLYQTSSVRMALKLIALN